MPRVGLEYAEPGKVMLSGKEIPALVADYSLGGFRLKIHATDLKGLKLEKHVEVRWRNQTFLGDVRYSFGTETGVEAGVGLSTLENLNKTDVTFTSEDGGWDLIENPEKRDEILGDVHYKGAECVMTLHQISGTAQVFVTDFKEGKLTCEVIETKRGSLVEGPVSARFELFQTCHAFESKLSKSNQVPFGTKTEKSSEKYAVPFGQIVELEVPNILARLLRRETVRVSLEGKAKILNVRVRGKSVPNVVGHDGSENGLSLIDPSHELMLPVGCKIDEIELELWGQDGTITTVVGHAVVRGYHWIEAKKEYGLGLTFVPATEQQKTVWHNFILGVRYPSLKFVYDEKDHGGIWSLFDRSGFLDLKPREAFTPAYESSKLTWKKLKEAGTKFSKRVQIIYDGNIVGHLQMDRIYSETWCTHHLAIDPKISKVVGKDLYAVVADVVSGEGADYFFSLTNSQKPWNQRNYFDFVSQYKYPSHNEIKILELYELDLRKNLLFEQSNKINIRYPNDFDLKRIVKYFETNCSDLEVKSCSLSLDDITLEKLNEDYKKYNLERQRSFLIAEKDGLMKGFARVETGSSGVSIFGMLNKSYIYTIGLESESEKKEITESLVSGIATHVKKINKTNFMVLLEKGNKEFLTSKGLQYIFDAALWMGRSVVSRRYHTFSQSLFGHLILKRERMHKKNKTQE